MTLVIANVFPDLLGTYGDGGNAIVLERRAIWRDIDARVIQAPSGEPLPKADLYCLGGGEDGPQVRAARELLEGGALRARHDDGAVIFAVCAGFQILGNHFPGANGQRTPGLSLLDIETARTSEPRAVGEVIATVSAPDLKAAIGPLTGFENHGGRTTLGAGVTALARVTSGIGNGGGDHSEGAIADRILATYLHGPVLARNPDLADVLLSWALPGVDLAPVRLDVVNRLRAERLNAARTT